MNSDFDKHNFIAQQLKKDFILRYGTSDNEIIFATAPARVNVIGEHIDYNGGLVFPAAINLYLTIALRKRNDKKIFYESTKLEGRHEFFADGEFKFDPKNSYANYLNGMLKYLKNLGLNLNSGFEILITSEIPEGSSISSSAALQICFGTAVCFAFSLELDKITLAKTVKRTENEFLNVQTGIMDQFIIAMGKRNNAVLLDTATLKYEYVPLTVDPYRIVIMNSNKPRKLTESKYNERKSECEKALEFLKEKKHINFLCDLNFEDFKNIENSLKLNLGEVICRRVRHCVTEMERVKSSVLALKENNLARLGKYLKESHLSLKHDYEVTGKELDSLFFSAIDEAGCLGARMTGAGFSGCAIAIVHKDAFDSFTKNVKEKYKKETGLDASFFACEVSDGAFIL